MVFPCVVGRDKTVQEIHFGFWNQASDPGPHAYLAEITINLLTVHW